MLNQFYPHRFFRQGLPFFAGLLLATTLVVGCGNTQEEIDAILGKRDTREIARGVESFLSQEGKLKAKLKAPLMYRSISDTQYLEFPESLHVDFYNDSTEIETWLDSKYGKYYEALDKVYLRDSVVIITINQDTLRCHDLWWDQKKGIFYTDSVATYRSPGNDVVGGKGMEATQDLKTVTFKTPLASMQVNSDGFAEQ